MPHWFDPRFPNRPAIIPPPQPPMFGRLSVRDLNLLMDAIPLHRNGRMNEFTEETRVAWALAMDELKQNGQSLAEVPQRGSG